jgi:hypothetical protein
MLGHVGGHDGLGETGPAAARFEFVRRCEKRLSGDDINVDARLLVVVVFAGKGPFRARLLGHAVLLRRQWIMTVPKRSERHKWVAERCAGPSCHYRLRTEGA